MKFDKRLVLVALAALAVGFFVAQNQRDSIIPNPFVPAKPDRPVLRFIAKVAKTVLWVAVFAEPKPPMQPDYRDHAAIGPDGHQVLNHGEGW